MNRELSLWYMEKQVRDLLATLPVYMRGKKLKFYVSQETSDAMWRSIPGVVCPSRGELATIPNHPPALLGYDLIIDNSVDFGIVEVDLEPPQLPEEY